MSDVRNNEPPAGLPAYRVLTGPDDAAFSYRVSEALALGYRLHSGPTVSFNGKDVIVAQALLWPGTDSAAKDRSSQTAT